MIFPIDFLFLFIVASPYFGDPPETKRSSGYLQDLFLLTSKTQGPESGEKIGHSAHFLQYYNNY